MRIHSYGFWIFNDREGTDANLGIFSMVIEKNISDTNYYSKLSMSVGYKFILRSDGFQLSYVISRK